MDRSLVKDRSGGENKSPFKTIFIILSMVLMLLPFIGTVNEFMTRILVHWQAYKLLEDWVVPYEAKLVAAIFRFLPVDVAAAKGGVFLNGGFLSIEWNCLGWQSAVLLLATLATGMQGKFKAGSRFETVVIGIMGTYLINFARIIIVGIFAITFGQLPATIFHDYFSLVFLVVWFFVFWWFSYSYVLEPEAQTGEGNYEIT